MRKYSNLESRFSNIDTTWKSKTAIIAFETITTLTNFSKNYLQSQSFFAVSNQKQIIFILGGTGSSECSCFNWKRLAKFFPTTKKLYQIPYILCNPLWYLFVQSSDTNLLAERQNLGLQCIYRAQLIIQKTDLHCLLPCNFFTTLLAYCRV